MTDIQAMVREYHEKFHPEPAHLDEHILSRLRIIDEEHDEVRVALWALLLRQGDFETLLADSAHELADLVYACYGAFERLGIDGDAAIAAVHESNMLKEPNPQGGKAVKGPHYRKPNMLRAIRPLRLTP